MNIPFFPELRTKSWMLSATTTFTGSSFTSGIASDFLYAFNFPSCTFQKKKELDTGTN